MVSSSLQHSRTLSVSKTSSGLYWHSSSMNCSVMLGGKWIKSWLMPSLENKRHGRQVKFQFRSLTGKKFLTQLCVVSYTLYPSKKSVCKRKIMLSLLVTSARYLLGGISFVPQRILLMLQYKLDYQRPLWNKIPAQTLRQQFYSKDMQRSHVISLMQPYGLWVVFFLDADHLFFLQTLSEYSWRNTAFCLLFLKLFFAPLSHILKFHLLEYNSLS